MSKVSIIPNTRKPFLLFSLIIMSGLGSIISNPQNIIYIILEFDILDNLVKSQIGDEGFKTTYENLRK